MIKIVNNCSSYLNPILNQIQESFIPIELFDYIGIEIYTIGNAILESIESKNSLSEMKFYIIKDLIYVKMIIK